MQLQSVTQNFYKISDYLPQLQLSSLKKISQKIKIVSMPAIVLIGSMLIQGAKADDYVDCINACDRNGRDAHELAKLLCYAMCWLITK